MLDKNISLEDRARLVEILSAGLVVDKSWLKRYEESRRDYSPESENSYPRA